MPTGVCLFTDTLADVNGVSRFIRSAAEQARTQGRALTVITSTRLKCPEAPNIINVRPVAARAMPRYENLELAFPPPLALLRLARRLDPAAVHISTPGPVGTVGRWVARRLGVPILGTYHTDFPAYIDHLFEDRALTWVCTRSMERFYRPFDRIFTRSRDYRGALERLGVEPGRIVRLLPGIDTSTFHVRHRPADVERFWSAYPGVDPRAVKALYVGRVSVEKNLPMLAKVWGSLPQDGTARQLIVIGDGPYRSEMQQKLRAPSAIFLGFRHGEELSRLYGAADMFLFPSTTDTLGQVVMEAQSAGLPVVVTDKGGPSEVVEAMPREGATGFVLGSEDLGAWRRTILDLCEDAGLRGRLGRAGHAAIQGMTIADSFAHFWSVHEEAIRAYSGHASRGDLAACPPVFVRRPVPHREGPGMS